MSESGNLGVPPEFKLFSAAEVAEILSVSQSHLCAMRDVMKFIEQGGTPLNKGELK